MRTLRCFILIILLSFYNECTPVVTVGTFPPEIDEQIKHLNPPRDKALIFVLRPEPVIRETKIQITCDGEFMGFTKAGMYLAFLVDPGLHILTSEDSIRIVDDFSAFYQKLESRKFRLFSSRNEKEAAEEETKAHILFIKKHNYAMQCYRSQTCDADELNRILINKPMPLEMYHAISVMGGNKYYLIQSFRSGLNQPQYLLEDEDANRALSFLKNLRHTRYINPIVFPKSYIKLNSRY